MLKHFLALFSVFLLAACAAPVIQEPPVTGQEEVIEEEEMEEEDGEEEEMMEDEEDEDMEEDAIEEENEDMMEEEEEMEVEETAEDEEEEMEEDREEQVRTINVTVDSWSFSPATITAKKGEKVELTLVGKSGAHGFAIPGLGINVPISAGETKSVTLPTDTEGTFEFFCNVSCGSGHRDMRGSVVIE